MFGAFFGKEGSLDDVMFRLYFAAHVHKTQAAEHVSITHLDARQTTEMATTATK